MENLYKAIAHIFDDFTQPCAAGSACPIPFLWAEEAHADAAVYEEQKKLNEWFETFGGDPLKSEQWKVAKVLSKLAEENGWKYNRSGIDALDGLIYKINPSPDNLTAHKPKPKPTSDKQDIDMEMLAKMMEDFIYPLVLIDQPQKMERQQYGSIQEMVLVELATRNCWRMTDPSCYGYKNVRKVYRIV